LAVVKVSRSVPTVHQSASTLRAAADLSRALSLAKACSIELRAGL
jgi:hypothetical protein